MTNMGAPMRVLDTGEPQAPLAFYEGEPLMFELSRNRHRRAVLADLSARYAHPATLSPYQRLLVAKAARRIKVEDALRQIFLWAAEAILFVVGVSGVISLVILYAALTRALPGH